MAIDLTPNVYAHWKLNESSGVLVSDSSVNGRDGTTVNMTDSDWVSGKLNNCLDFDGLNDYVNCGNIAGFEKNEPFTLECWFKTGGTGHVIVSKISTANTAGYYIITAVGKIYFRLQNTAAAIISVVTIEAGFNNNAWHHIICTYDGSEDGSGCHIYIDGVDKSLTIEYNSLSGTITNAVSFNIANMSNLSYHYGGKLDEVVIYDKELSSSEVLFRYHNGNGTEDMASTPPTAPNNPIPVDTATGISYNQNLDWDSDGDLFDIYFGTGSPPPLVDSDEPSSDWTIPYNLDSCTKYYWKIVAKNNWGDETAGAEWDFTTGNELPVIPNTPTPINGATGQNLGLTLEWDSEDYNPNDTLVYDIYFGTAANPPLLKANHGSKTYTVSGLINDQRYYWKIIARDDASCGTHETISPIWNFKTKLLVTGGYEAFDPRKIIRTQLATNHKIDGELRECIKVTDAKGKDMYIPMYVEEESKLECPPLPVIRLDLLAIREVPHDIKAAVRQHTALIGIDIAFHDMDNIDVTSFGKKVADRIVDLTRYYQIDTSGVQFYNVENQGRIVIENRCEEVILHWVMELEATFNDAC